MNASKLSPGDVFVEVDEAEYAELPKRERAKLPRATYIHLLGACRDWGRIHVRTSRGDWCIHEEAPVMIVERVSTPKRGLARVA